MLKDITGRQAIRDNIDKKLKDSKALTQSEKKHIRLNPFILNLSILIPVFGTFILDKIFFGKPQISAIIADWIIGGFIPLILITINFITKTDTFLFIAFVLYVLTRIGICIIVNEHIYTYNKYIKQKLY